MYPFGNVTLSGTTLYGMTERGGGNGLGNIFSSGTGGTNYNNLVSFSGAGGAASGLDPFGSLTLNGTTLYGMTSQGGANGDGNIFSLGADGTNYQTVLSFTGTGGAASGKYPQGNLILSGTTLYGMTMYGGAKADGNIFSVGVDGTNYQSLVSFSGTGGAASGNEPYGNLTLSGTTLYGMTYAGGSLADGNIFSVGLNGTNFKNLVSFTGSGGLASGNGPRGSLILSGTTLYGTTLEGGANGEGNIFSLGIDGSDYTNLYSFTGGSDGDYPRPDLTLSGGTLFGETGGGDGTVFALALPAAPAPEPGTLALVGAAAVALVSYRWRRTPARR